MSRRKSRRIKSSGAEEGKAVGPVLAGARASAEGNLMVAGGTREEGPLRARFSGILRAALYGIFPVLFGLVGVAFVRLETGAIYLWDFATYWNQVLQVTNYLRQGGSFGKLLKTVYDSTAAQDYNLLPSLPLVPFQWIGLDARAAYILGICLLYGGALYLVCCALYSCFADNRSRAWTAWAGGLLMLSTATVWWPMFRGFVDVIALASALAGVACAIVAESHRRASLCYFLSGALLALAPVLRRSYSFYLLSFIALFSVWLLTRIVRRLPDVRLAFQENAAMASIYLGVAAVFGVFHGFLVRSIKMDHGVHSSYKTALPLWGEWFHMLGWFGLIPLLAALTGMCLLFRAGRFKGSVVLGIGASVLGTVLQMRTASLGEHHRYIMVAGFLVAMSASLGAAASGTRTPLSRAFLCLAFASILATASDLHGAGSKGDWFPNVRENPLAAENRNRPVWWLVLFGCAGPKPLVRNDLTELQRLYATLDRISATDPNPQVYLLSSGVILGDGVISASLIAPPGLKLQAGNRFLPIHQIDSRDGTPTNILHASHVLTTFPLDLHLKPDSHKCVVVPWEQFRDGRGFARAFERMADEFHLDNNVTAVLYRRTRPTTREDVAELETDLRKSGLLK